MIGFVRFGLAPIDNATKRARGLFRDVGDTLKDFEEVDESGTPASWIRMTRKRREVETLCILR